MNKLRFIESDTEVRDLDEENEDIDIFMPVLKAKRIVNLTPHPVIIYVGEDPVLEISPELTPARLSEDIEQQAFLDVEGVKIPVNTLELGEVRDLPDPEENVFYVVSRVLLDGLPDRKDLLVPMDMVRDGSGRIIGCRAFSRNKD